MHPDILVIRHSLSGAPYLLADKVNCGVINAGDGQHEHPTQALIDCYTLRERWEGDFSNKKITILGDILFSRVARSNIWALKKLGAPES